MVLDREKGIKTVSAAGIAVLSCGYIIWSIRNNYGIPGRIAALASAVQFATVCLRFVPLWFDFWAGSEKKKKRAQKAACCIEIFPLLLLYCFAVLLLSWLIRCLTGWEGSFKDSLGIWLRLDSNHFLDIARDWYISEGDWDRVVQLVFLPGYPLAIRFVNLFIGDWLYSALILSAFCFAAAGCVFYKLLRLDMRHEKAIRVIVFLCLIPGAFFYAAPMSESLFILLCFSCLYLVRCERWLLGGIAGAFACFTRSQGLALIVPVLFELVHRLREKGEKPWRAIGALLVIPLGYLAYCVINYSVSGEFFKFMEYQRVHWHQGFSWFFNTAAYQTENFIGNIVSGRTDVALGLWFANLFCCFGSLLLMLLTVKKLRPSYSAYYLGYFFVAASVTWLISGPRYMAACFTLPIALAELSDKPKTNLMLSIVLAALNACYLCAFILGWQVW